MCLRGEVANAEASSADSMEIRVDRVVQVEIGGAVVISDAVKLSPKADMNVKPLSSFVIGLPCAYQGNLFHYFAYDATNKLDVTPSVDPKMLCGMGVQFKEAIDLAKTGSYDFTVVYVLSGLIALEGKDFNVSFPLYPLLQNKLGFYNITVVLPPRTLYVNSSLHFDNTTRTTPQYSYQILNRTESDVRPFENQTSWVTFTHSGLPKEFFLIELDQVRREITLDPWGALLVSDFYQITNKGESLSRIPFYIPRNATGISAQDIYGSIPKPTVEDEGNVFMRVSVSLRELLEKNEKTKLTLNYRLPFMMHVKQNGFEDYTLTLDFLNLTHYVARNVSVKVILPEGGQSLGETVTDYDNVTRFHNLNSDLEYRYNIFWASFRPVTWVGILATIFCAFLFLKKPAKPVAVVTPIPPDSLRRFVDAYEERTRLSIELRSIERQVRTGKLSKRQHRLRRDSIGSRLSRLRKGLSELRAEIEQAGGRYAGMMRQLEVAEAELEALEEDIRRVEARYQRREISAEAYRRLLDEYGRRRERAENAISEVILRLREEL